MKCVAHPVPVASLCLHGHAHGPQHAPLLVDGLRYGASPSAKPKKLAQRKK
jgi:hypothetical protein